MASSSAGSSRSSSSSRKVERTLSDSSFGNMMPSLKAPTATSRDKGKKKAAPVQEEDDDIIVVESGGARQTSSSMSRQPSASSAAASTAAKTTSRSARPNRPTPSEASSSTRVASKSTQRKRKAEPGDGFKMDFKHTQATAQATSTSRNSPASSRDSTRASQPRPPALPPSSSSFASSSRSHHSSTKHNSLISADAPSTQSKSSFISMLPSALAGSTQGKPKLKPLHAFRPPSSINIRSTSPLSSPLPARAIAQPPPPPPPSSRNPSAVQAQSRSPAPPPAPIKVPSPRKRIRSPPRPRSPTIDRILARTDWAELHPSLEVSHLFRLEYALHGGLTYNQARTAPKENKGEFARVTRKTASASVQHEEPSWVGDEAAVRTLKQKLGDKEHFVAVVWARDVLGRNKMEEGSVGEEGELRKTVIGGVDMYLLGKEFPLQLVIVVGIIVGISESDTTISYQVDDGTAVITCVCALRQHTPIFILPPRKPDDIKTPSPRKRKVEELVEAGEDRLEVGTLVRAVGRVEEHLWATTADRMLIVEKMEALSDANLEVEHHLQVARLHREVYSKPLDLNARLAQIKQAETEQWSHLSSSQASSSNAGTPTKRIRLSRPIKLHDDDITPQNFVTYIRQHLRDHHVDRPSPSASQPSSTAGSSGIWELKFASQGRAEEPTPFTLDDLESDRQLVMFATRLAQKLEREKRARKKVGASGREKDKLWVSKTGKAGFTSVKGVGSHGGSSLLLRTVSSGLKSSKERETTVKEEQPLEGLKLEKAISKCFREALIEMRKKGVIVLSAPEMEESRWAADSRTMDDSRYLPDDPSYSRSPKGTADSYPADGGPWSILFAEEEEERRPSPKQSNDPRDAPVKPQDTQGGPWDLVFADSNEMDSVAAVSSSPSKSDSPPRRLTQPFWDIILEGDEDKKDSITKDIVSKDLHTPRSTRTQSSSHLPSSASTVKPTRTTNLDSKSLSLSHQNSRIPSSPPAFNLPSLFQSPRGDRTFATDSSWSTSIAAVEQETYELVTHTSLAPHVLRVLRNLLGGQSFGSKSVEGGVPERGIRQALVRDERWAGVASYSDLVGMALKVLEEQGEVQRFYREKKEEWKPTRGLGFSKGRS